MDRKYLRNVVNIVLFLVGVVLVCLFVPRFLVFFMPFVVGWIIAMIANPLVRFMEKRLKIVRKHSSMVIIIGTIALIVLGGYGILSWLAREIYGFIGILPDLYEALLGDLENTGANLAGLSEKIPPELVEKLAATINSLTESLGNLISTIGGPTVTAAGNIAKNIPNILVNVIFTILSAYFFIAERDKIIQWGREHTPEELRSKWRFITGKFRGAVGGYFRAQFKIMGVVAVILLVGFFVLRIKYALLWAILISIQDFLPFFGTGTALIPWAALKVLSGNYKFAVGLIIIYLVSQLVRQVIQPKIVGDTIGLNPLSTMVFMYIGYKIGGIIAMIIAVPIGLIVINLYEAGAFEDIIKDVKELAEGLNQYRKGE